MTRTYWDIIISCTAIALKNNIILLLIILMINDNIITGPH